MNTNPHIFIINLEKDTKRKAHMEELCQKYSLSCQFIKAIVGKDLSEDYIKTVYSKETAIQKIGRELGCGEIGCALSHIKIYKKILDDSLPYAIIFEDDIEILHDINVIINNYHNFPSDLELLLLGEYCNPLIFEAQRSSFWRWHTIVEGYRAVRLTEVTYGAHGYLITNRGAKRLLEQLSKIALPLDLYTGDEKYINMYALRPRIVMPNIKYSLQSNLEDERIISLQNQTNITKQKDSLRFRLLTKLGLQKPLKRLYRYFKLPKKYTINHDQDVSL